MAPTSVARRRPDWWQTRSLKAYLLLPLALLFRVLAGLRRKAFQLGILSTRKLSVPVIVIGNIAVGGSGKTPVVIWLAANLRAKGWQPGILSRGYGGNAQIPTEVTPASNPEVVGDEPILLARRTGCPMWVGRDRHAAGQALLAAHPEINVIITDDGLQHYRLHRDAEVVVIDETILGNRWPLPAGPLREPLGRLASANLLIVHGKLSESLRGKLPAIPTVAMHLEAGRFYRMDDPTQQCDASTLTPQPLRAIAGIARPERFFETLRSLGLTLASTRALPDHHAFSHEDLLTPNGEVLLLTEKDAVKCSSFAPSNAWVLPVEARIEVSALDHLLECLHGPKTA
jgi:tetraacyldisaccharide 4'-kinase